MLGALERLGAEAVGITGKVFSGKSHATGMALARITTHMVRIAAVGDLHYSKTAQGTWQPLFAQIGQAADLLLLCGDLTDYGLAEEGEGLAREIKAAIKIPVVA